LNTIFFYILLATELNIWLATTYLLSCCDQRSLSLC